MKQFDSIIFTHIPKCGGSSFRSLLYNSSIESGIAIDKCHIPGEGKVRSIHNIPNLTPSQIKNMIKKQKKIIIGDHSKYNVHLTYKLNHIKNPFYFTIFREPIKRFISHYNFFYRLNAKSNYYNIPFTELNYKTKIKLLHLLENLQTIYLQPSRKTKKCDKKDFEFALCTVGGLKIKFGILEDINKSLQLIQHFSPDWITFSSDFPLQNKAKYYDNTLTNKDLELIKEYHYFDLHLYDYAINLFNTLHSTLL